MLALAQRTDDSTLVVIWITIWIQEFLKDFFIIALTSNIGDAGPLHSANALVDTFNQVKTVIICFNYDIATHKIK